jgi:hypothetical protein
MEFTLPGTRALCNTLAPSGLKRRLSVAPGAWETGRSTISISSVRGAFHAHRAMGPPQVKPEGGEGERDGVQEGGNSCLQGRTQSAPGDLEQKKSSHGRLQRGTGNITQGIRIAGRWTRPSSGAVISLPASSSSSHGHSRAKLASQLTLLLYHTWSPSVADPQSHRTGLLTRLKSSILAAPPTGSIAEREAGSACSRGEERSSGAVSRRGMQSLSIMESSHPCLSRKKRILTSSHTRPGPEDRAFECPVTVASCITLFARSNVAPMLQEKELSDSQLPAVAVPPRCKRTRAGRSEVLLWGVSCSS